MADEKPSVKETLSTFLKFMNFAWKISDPIRTLENCIENEEWFKGVVLSTAFFEGIGIEVLSSHFRNQIDPEKFKHIRSVDQITVLLHTSGIIDQPTYSMMIGVNKFRNSLVHFEPYTPRVLKPERAKEAIKKAIICLEKLITKWKIAPIKLKWKI